MDSDEKLRLEILQLSSMIAASNGGNTSGPNRLISTPVRTLSHYNANRLQHYPSNYRQSYSLANRLPLISSYKLVRYPNPFVKLCSESYTSQVFPSHATPTSTVSLASNVSVNNIIAPPTSSSNSSYASRYKLKNISNGIKVEGSTKSASAPSVPFVAREIKAEKVEDPKPKSIYLNRSHLAKLDSEGSLINLTLSPRPVRPHVNPAHFQILSANGSNNVAVPATSSLTNFQYHTTQPNAMPSTNGCDISSVKSSEQVRISNANTLKTTYKLDRRLKRSPVRKGSKAKIISPDKIQIVPSTKVFKRYSMRMVSGSKLGMSRWQHPRRKSALLTVALHRQLNRKLSQRFSKSHVGLSSLKNGAVRKGHKSVVHIDGSKYITKNGGKTLKRMSSKVNNVVSINGNRFIRKNGGKSLKRLSESLSSFKNKPLVIHSQTQTPQARLANRAVLKSKLTLSQRSWKKKQFCMFYNRFGECKPKENGNCPYVHDRKQLLICPKFVVGKCTSKECKLSHDLKEGRMPPCQFFNKSECSRENCPYPHIKSSPHTKKSAETVKGKTDAKTKSPPRKRKLSTRKDSSPVKKTDKKSKTDRKDPKARYYEQSPVSQPIEIIVPRRLPKDSERTSTEDKPSTPPPTSIVIAQSTSSTMGINSFPNGGTSSTTTSSANDDRRMRLMSRIFKLHERVKKKESTAPQFLPFN